VSETSDLVAETVSNLPRVEELFPRRFLRNGHLQTLVGNFKPRQYVLPEAEAHLIEVDAEDGASTGSQSSGCLTFGVHYISCHRVVTVTAPTGSERLSMTPCPNKKRPQAFRVNKKVLPITRSVNRRACCRYRTVPDRAPASSPPPQCG
jgi:hypothetical protein